MLRFPTRELAFATLLSCCSCAQVDPPRLPTTSWNTIEHSRPQWMSESEDKSDEFLAPVSHSPRQADPVGGWQERTVSIEVLVVEEDSPVPELQAASDESTPGHEAPPLEHAEPGLPLLPVPDDYTTPDVVYGRLNYHELAAMALANNPTLRQADALVRQAEGNHVQVGLYPNPTIGYQGDEIGDADTAGRQGIFVSQTIVTADKLKLNRNVAAWNIEQSRWQAEAQRFAVLNTVRIRYYEVLAAQTVIESAEELLDILERGVRTARDLLEAGEVPETDVLQAEIELDTVRLALRNARHQERAARRELAAVVGVTELPPDRISGSLHGAIPSIDHDAQLAEVLVNSPVLRAARAEVQRARAQLCREEVQPIPDVDVEGVVSNDYADNQPLLTVRVGIMLPVHNRNQGNISAARSAIHAAVENVNRLELMTRQELANTYRRYSVAETQVSLYRESLLPKAERTLELATEGYQAGEADFLRVLTARRTWVESQLNYVRALADLRIAIAELEGLLITGGLNAPTQTVQQVGGSAANRGGRGSQPLTVTPTTSIRN